MPGWNENNQPWLGPHKCRSKTRDDRPCANHEIDGLEHCWWHMPADLRAEAEELTGWTYCSATPMCWNPALEGTEPRLCGQQHAVAGSTMSKQAANRVVEGRVTDRFMEIMSADGERLLNPRRIEDPLTELLLLAAEVKEMKNMLLEVVSAMKPGQWRYQGKAGEQARAELILLERAQERLASLLVNLIKLKIEDRLAGVEERTLELIERAMNTAIIEGVRAVTKGGTQLQAQQAARDALRRELPVLAASA